MPDLLLVMSLQAFAGLWLTHGYRWYLARSGYGWNSGRRIWLKALLETVLLACLQSLIGDLITSAVYRQWVWKQADLMNFVGSIYNWMRYLGVWIIIYYMYKILDRSRAIEREKMVAENNSRLAELELLKTQLNPHFLFNALNSIKALVVIDPEKCRNAIVQLSEILRFTLQYSREKLIPVEQELSETTKYLALEQLRFDSRLHWEVDNKLPGGGYTIPPAMLLTLAENAVKHGIGGLAEGGIIKITVQDSAGMLLATMYNSGKYVPGERVGLGLRQVRARLQELFGEAAQLTIKNENEGVKATICIPQQLPLSL
jgi:LytS/YehU family sensor histidine kinase